MYQVVLKDNPLPYQHQDYKFCCFLLVRYLVGMSFLYLLLQISPFLKDYLTSKTMTPTFK